MTELLAFCLHGIALVEGGVALAFAIACTPDQSFSRALAAMLKLPVPWAVIDNRWCYAPAAPPFECLWCGCVLAAGPGA